MICQQCKKEFIPKKTGYWKKRKFCSLKCNSLSQKGKKRHFSKQWRENISKSMKGRKISELHKQRIGLAHKGKKAPKLSIYNKKHNGKEHPNWKGGISPEAVKFRQIQEYKDWRFAVFTRDNFTCVECKATKCYIVADHIKPFSLFPELRLDLNNGQTLCIPCHKVKTAIDRKIIAEARNVIIRSEAEQLLAGNSE